MTEKKPVWTAPTRRAFVAMIGLGAAALAAVKIERERETEPVAETSAPPSRTRWIGHC